MTNPIGIGLIGLGRHGIRYARHLLHDLPEARLVAVCRQNPSLGIGLPVDAEIPCYGEAQELIHDPRVEALVVVTPPRFNLDICLLAVQARKPLLIEKPLAPTGPAAWEMVQAAANMHVPLMTAHTLRFDPATVSFKTQLCAMGQPHYLTLTTRLEHRPHSTQLAGGDGTRGVLLEVGIHLLDLVRYLTGEDVAAVTASMDRSDPHIPETRAAVQLRTSTGMPCLIDVARVSVGRVGRGEWIASRGQLLVDWQHHRLTRLTAQEGTQEMMVVPQPTIIGTLRAYVEALRGGQPFPVTGLDGLKAVRIADACYRSAERGGQLVDVERDG